MRALNRLTAVKVDKSPPGKYADGGGLWLYKRPDGGAQWVLRITIHGSRKEMGLGALQNVSLKEVRLEAEKWRAFARQNINPIKEREKQRRESAKASNTLADVALEAFDVRKAELRQDGKAGQWFTPLKLHVLPRLGRIPVEEIDQRDIKNTLAPIWHTKADTAKKAINRLGIVMQHAAAMGLDVDIQAVAKAKALLGKQRHTVTPIPALPWQAVPAFYETLSSGTLTQLALRLLILTAGTRSKPIRFMRIDQVDGDVWIVPAENMKGRKGAVTDFRVPLSQEALHVIDLAKPFMRDGFLFPSVRRGVISDATMARYMEREGMTARPHGFRSSFRTWAADTNAPWEVSETALAHTVGSKVERTYQRTDYLEQRRILLERWADHVTGGTGEVVQLVAT
ncbi:integrase arm-type DNA-binding domain-containing protein [Rhodobacteraceae bacterium R_SAG10]|nr:integrase arm-type DNA-binding domain-containing protein [Rhodobacteraceae bacterium R_SAG10]